MLNKLKLTFEYTLPVLFAGFLTACGGGSSTESGGNQNANTVVNGFRVSHSTAYDEFDVVIRTEEYDYDNVTNTINRMVTTVYEPEFANTIATTILVYDERGNLIERDSFYDEDFNTTASFEFDTNNLMTSSRSKGFDDGIITSSYLTLYTYNNAGQIIRRVETDEIAAADFGDSYEPSTSEYTYDSNGIRQSGASIITYYFDGVLDERLSSEMQYTFNDLGQMVRRERTYDDGRAPAINLYSYDENGNMFEFIGSAEAYYSREVFEYEPNSEPVYNYWLRLFKFFL